MSTHTDPIVLTVLYVADQRHPWKLAPIERLRTRYHTPTTVATEFGTIDATVKRQTGKSGVTKQQYHVWCVPDDAQWSRVVQTRAQLQQAIDLFAGTLRLLGSYAKRLDDAGGIKKAPTPLYPTVISAPDPDDPNGTYFVSNPIPRIARRSITGHTPKMLRALFESSGHTYETTISQRDHFICPADDHWKMVEDRRADAQRAYDAWLALLKELGTYQDALADGRYATTKEAPPVKTTTTDRSPGRWGDATHNLPPLLSGWRWATNSVGEASLLAPDGWTTKSYKYSNKAISEALRRVHSQPKAAAQALAVVEASIVGVAMMDAAEARETLDSMRGDLGQIDLSIGSLRQKALDFADRQGWKALGYSSSAEAINAELGTQYSKSYLSRLLNAAKIERLLELPTGNSTPERTLRPLGQLAPAEQKAAWQEATAAAGGATPTTAQVQQAVEQIKPPPAPALPNSDAQHIGAARRILATLDQWDQREHTRLIQEAYSHARQIRDTTQYQAMMAEIDRAVEGQALAPSTAVSTPVTPESRDAAGPWFWASKSAVHPTAHCWHRWQDNGTTRYVSACGLDLLQQPTSGAKGFHCGVCEKNADRREIVPIPGAAPAHDLTAALTDPIGSARSFVAEQRERISHFSPHAMVSLKDHQVALDQIEALLAMLGEYGPVPTLESEVGA